jgi:hypothetical protein
MAATHKMKSSRAGAGIRGARGERAQWAGADHSGLSVAMSAFDSSSPESGMSEKSPIADIG